MNEILKKIDWKVLEDYIFNKLIIINKHPLYDIWILNYSKEVQFSRAWDLMTSSCRGLVIDAEGNILARCMKKFKNYEEYDPKEIDWSQDFEVFDKIDGSMIISCPLSTAQWPNNLRGMVLLLYEFGGFLNCCLQFLVIADTCRYFPDLLELDQPSV